MTNRPTDRDKRVEKYAAQRREPYSKWHPPHGFIFYPAGQLPADTSPVGVYVKYQNNPSALANGIEVIATSSKWLHVRCPDRDLLIVKNAHEVGSDRPMGNWDEFVSASLDCSSGRDLGVAPSYMLNFVSSKARANLAANQRRADTLVKSEDRLIMVDSGGYQLVKGREDFIDPRELAQWANDNVDQCMTVDIPLWDATDLSEVKRAARLQRLNTNMIYDHLDPRVELFNVTRGMTQEQIKRHHDLVVDDRMTGLAISSIYLGNVYTALYRAYCFLAEYGNSHYRQIHLLGLYNTSVLAPMFWLFRRLRETGMIKDTVISSDSSSGVQLGIQSIMVMPRLHTQTLAQANIGRFGAIFVPNGSRLLPCGCPICSTVKYQDVLGQITHRTARMLLTVHNLGAMRKWTDMMSAYANTLSFEDYAALCKLQLEKRSQVLPYLRFVEELFESGPKKTAARYSAVLGSGMFSDGEEVSEEGFAPAAENESGEEQEEPSKNDLRREGAKRGTVMTYKKYEAFHKNPEGFRISQFKGESLKKEKKVRWAGSTNTSASKKKKTVRLSTKVAK